jgi:hypothetical protein
MTEIRAAKRILAKNRRDPLHLHRILVQVPNNLTRKRWQIPRHQLPQ